MKIIITVLIVCLFSVGCTYDFSSDNFIDIEEPTLENLIDLNNFSNLDTINIPSQIRYTLNGNTDQQFIDSRVFLDNNEITSSVQDNEGGFNLYPDNYNDGIHIIRIESVYSSGTGSIADQIEFEFIEEILEYQFIVHRNPSKPPNITETVIENGSITVKWIPINEPEYVNAYLSLEFIYGETRIPLTHEMLTQGTYIDKSTVLYERNTNRENYDIYSKVTYSIVFESDYTELYSETQTVTCDPEWLALEVSYVDLNSFKIKWPKHPLYANFDSFEIDYVSTNFFGSNEGGDYLISSPYIFGKAYSGSMSPYSSDRYFNDYTTYEMACDEETFGLFDFDKLFSKVLLYNSNNQQYYALIIEDKIGVDFIIYVYQYSSNFEFIKKTRIAEIDYRNHRTIEFYIDQARNKLYLDADNTYILDPIDLGILNEYTNEGSSVSKEVRGNILKSWDSSQEVITLLNIETNTLIHSGEAVDQGILSSNGKYVYINKDTERAVYKISNNALEKIIEVDYPSHDILIEDDMLFYISYDEIYLINLITKDVKSFLFGSNQQTLQYDSYSQKLIASQYGSHQIYDLNTDQIISLNSESHKSNPGEFYYQDSYYYLWIVNGILIHSKGIYVEIE